MNNMGEIIETLQDHEERIKSLELTRTDTLKALSDFNTQHEERLRDVRRGLEKQIEDMQRESRERDNNNAQRLDRLESKFDAFGEKMDGLRDQFGKAIKQTPGWVWPLLSAVIAVAGWLLGKQG